MFSKSSDSGYLNAMQVAAVSNHIGRCTRSPVIGARSGTADAGDQALG